MCLCIAAQVVKKDGYFYGRGVDDDKVRRRCKPFLTVVVTQYAHTHTHAQERVQLTSPVVVVSIMHARMHGCTDARACLVCPPAACINVMYVSCGWAFLHVQGGLLQPLQAIEALLAVTGRLPLNVKVTSHLAVPGCTHG